MKMSNWPKLGINTSKLGFGAMRLPKDKDGNIIQEEVNEMVKYAMEHGINYYDTAYVYGDGASELALGKALKPFDRKNYFIADKMPFFNPQGEDYLEKVFNTTLTRLDTDYVDMYLMHSMCKNYIKNMKDLDAINWAIEKKKQGKIKYIGFSIHDDYETLLEMLDLYDWDFVQIQYNYMDINDAPGQKGYEELRKRNIPIMIMEPLKGGILADISENLNKPYRDLGGSNVSYGFRWLAEQEGIATILSGMSSMQQLKDNIEIFEDIKPLNEKEYAAIEEVKENIKKSQKIQCTGCGYCIPCPQGVKIPQLFKSWNVNAMTKTDNWINHGDIDYANAELCIGCGICATRCPQHFDIPAKIKELLSEKDR